MSPSGRPTSAAKSGALSARDPVARLVARRPECGKALRRAAVLRGGREQPLLAHAARSGGHAGRRHLAAHHHCQRAAARANYLLARAVAPERAVSIQAGHCAAQVTRRGAHRALSHGPAAETHPRPRHTACTPLLQPTGFRQSHANPPWRPEQSPGAAARRRCRRRRRRPRTRARARRPAAGRSPQRARRARGWTHRRK